jgi:hypothetical protein
VINLTLKKQVKNPTDGQVIRTVTQPMGMIELVEVDPTSSVGQIIKVCHEIFRGYIQSVMG